MNKGNSQRYLPIASVAIAIASLAGVAWLHHRVQRLSLLPQDIQLTAAAATQQLEATAARERARLTDGTIPALRETSRKLTELELQRYESRLRDLSKQFEETQELIETARTNRQRLDSGLPELVDLDALGVKYAGKGNGSSAYESAETFVTTAGEIRFSAASIDVKRVPGTGQVASVRIGKTGSTESAQLIKAWLAEAVKAKERMGYRREYQRTRPAEYGEVTEALYLKGDAYLKTYYQYERVLETYGRHSLQYTYYAEVGSKSRTDRMQLESYNQKLGS